MRTVQNTIHRYWDWFLIVAGGVVQVFFDIILSLSISSRQYLRNSQYHTHTKINVNKYSSKYRRGYVLYAFRSCDDVRNHLADFDHIILGVTWKSSRWTGEMIYPIWISRGVIYSILVILDCQSNFLVHCIDLIWYIWIFFVFNQ